MEKLQVGERWQLIKEFIDHEPAASPYIVKLRSYLGAKLACGELAPCRLAGDVLVFGDRHLDLSSKPLVLRLFRRFLHHHARQLSKVELIASIYESQQQSRLTGGQASRRLEESYSRNIVKLMSRARKLAREAFASAGSAESQTWPDSDPRLTAAIEWFAYDPVSRSYCLYRLR